MNTEAEFREDLSRVVRHRVASYATVHAFADSAPPYDELADTELIDAAETSSALRRWGTHCRECGAFFEPLARCVEISSLNYLGRGADADETESHDALVTRLLIEGFPSPHHHAALADFAASALMEAPDEGRLTQVALSEALAATRAEPAMAKTFGRLLLASFGYPGTMKRRARLASLRAELSAVIASSVPDWSRFHVCIALTSRFDALLGMDELVAGDLGDAVATCLSWRGGDPDLTACTDMDPVCRIDECVERVTRLAGDAAMLLGDSQSATSVYRYIRPGDTAACGALAALG